MQAFCGTDIKEWYSRTATNQPVQWVADLIATFKSSFPKVLPLKRLKRLTWCASLGRYFEAVWWRTQVIRRRADNSLWKVRNIKRVNCLARLRETVACKKMKQDWAHACCCQCLLWTIYWSRVPHQ